MAEIKHSCTTGVNFVPTAVVPLFSRIDLKVLGSVIFVYVAIEITLYFLALLKSKK